MSVLPYGRISDLSTQNYAALQRQQQEPKPAELNRPMNAESTRAAEQAFSAAARPGHSRAEHESAIFMRQSDARQIVRTMYRMGRLRGQHAAFDQVFWQDEVAKQAEEMLSVARRVEGGLREAAERKTSDPFRRYVALLEASERVKRDDNPKTPEQIEDALDEVWQDHEGEILAGFNTAPALMRFAEQIDEWDHFRELYALMVINGDALASIFKALLERFGARRLGRAVKALRDALAADLASPYVSSDRGRLVQLQMDLEGTHTISSMVAEGDNLYRKVHGGQTNPEHVMDFVTGVFDFVSFTTYADHKFNTLCTLLIPTEALTEPVRAQVRDFLKQRVPMGLWRNLEVRKSLFPSLFR